MGADKGNKYWTLRERHGSYKAYQPDELWTKACEYFEWIEDNPINKKETIVSPKGTTVKNIVHIRPFTEDGLSTFLGISNETWRNYKSNSDTYKDYFEVCEQILRIINSNKFEGAATGIFNANIIARDLGLTDKKEITKTKIIATNKRLKDSGS